MRHVPGHQVPEGEQKLYGKSGAVGTGTQEGLADLANPLCADGFRGFEPFT
jgi:hypothetical protein